jgi:hypothetical protein
MGVSCNAIITVVYQDAADNLYIGGNFTAAPDGTAAARLATSSDGGTTWTAFGTGCNAYVWDILVTRAGTLLVVGQFTLANGVTVNSIAKWTGATFATVGGTSCNNNIYRITETTVGTWYITGAFTIAPDGDTATNRIAVTINSGAAWNELAGELWTTTVYESILGADGKLYVASNVANVGEPLLAAWNGAAWLILLAATDISADAFAVRQDSLGNLWLGATYITDSITERSLLLWNGSTWVMPPVTLGAGTNYVETICAWQNELYFGGLFALTGQYQGLTTCTNGGSTSTYPIIKIKRSGGTKATVASLINYTTQKRVWLDYDLADGEELVLDFRPGRRSVTSSHFGVVWEAVLRNSDFSDFYLLPGANNVGAYVELTGAPTVTTLISWDVCHWSADGVAA